MSPRAYALIIGGVLAVVGFFALVFPVNLTVDGIIINEVECGTGFGMVDTAPIGAPADWRAQCASAVSTRQGLGWAGVGVGVLVLVGGMFVKTPKREETAS